MRNLSMKRLVTIGAATSALVVLGAAVPRESDAGFLDRLFNRISQLTQRTNTQRTAREVPEIDPSVVGSALTLVAGGIAILRDRRRKQ